MEREEQDWGWSAYIGQDQEFAFRDDLETAVGVIVGQPEHYIDEDGAVQWGTWPPGGPYGTRPVYQLLERELLAAIDDVLEDSPETPEFDRTRPTHLYDYPPAAQGIPEIAAMFWEHGYPLLDYAEKGYLAGKFIRNVVLRFRDRTKEPGTPEESSPDGKNYLGTIEIPAWAQPRITLTQGSIVSLIVAKIVDTVGFQEDLEIDSHARGFVGFQSPGHPDAGLTYLLRAAFGNRQYGYVVDAEGTVIEHFRVDSNELISLPTPNLFGEDVNEVGVARGPLEPKIILRTKEE